MIDWIKNNVLAALIIALVTYAGTHIIRFEMLAFNLRANILRVDELGYKLEVIHTNICELSLVLLDDKEATLKHCRE